MGAFHLITFQLPKFLTHTSCTVFESQHWENSKAATAVKDGLVTKSRKSKTKYKEQWEIDNSADSKISSV